VDHLSRLYAEGWAVNALAINKDVAVNNHLASLCHCAGEARTKNKGVKTHFQKLYQVLTG
jgi:hypothetical protein